MTTEEPDNPSICIEIIFRPGLPVTRRHQLEDALEAKLEPDEIAEVDGGGGYVDGEESNIFVYADDVDRAMPVIRSTLRDARAPVTTWIRLGESETTSPLYDESLRPRPWWRFW